MQLPFPVNPVGWRRWWVYQRERFPLFVHGPLIAAFSFSTLSFSRIARGATGGVDLHALVAAVLVSLLIFLQLRIADEHKDHEDDLRYRPYRAVPRGLVKLRELGVIGAGAAGVQVAVLLWLRPGMLLFLLAAWVYLGLMTFEFFIPHWLRDRPIIYMLSHMLIMPLIDLMVTACDWFVQGVSSSPSVLFLLAVSFGNGVIVEIGRKIRDPLDEEAGVETYSKLWGGRRAALVWAAALALTAVVAAAALLRIDFLWQGAPVLGLLLIVGVAAAVRYAQEQVASRAQRIERAAGFWVMGSYLTIGALPLVWRWLSGG